MNLTHLSERFRNFATLECEGSSSLYKELSLNVAEDSDLLLLSSHAATGQPVPNLLLGAVHYLLFKNKEHSLYKYYPSIVSEPLNPNDAFLEFKDFCKGNEQEIINILKTKRVQTNEVRRCAYLYPVFCYIYNMVERPLSLVEIGTSAGLQLLWDQYSYSYGDDQTYGNENSSLHLTSSVREGNDPSELQNSPLVQSRIGFDLNIVDLNHEEEYLWLKALIWPEHKERLSNLENAVEQFRKTSPKLVEGDGVGLLEEYAKEEVSDDGALCIFHTHVANQISEPDKHKLIDKFRELGKKRDVFHIYNNMWDRQLHLDFVINGVEYHEVVGDTDGHGRWFDWKVD